MKHIGKLIETTRDGQILADGEIVCQLYGKNIEVENNRTVELAHVMRQHDALVKMLDDYRKHYDDASINNVEKDAWRDFDWMPRLRALLAKDAEVEP